MKIFIVARRATLPRQLSAFRGLSWAASLIARIGAIGDKRSLSEQLTAIRTINRRGGWIFASTDRPAYQCLYKMADNPPLWKRRLRIFSRSVRQPSRYNWIGQC
ncbi:MAG: hypothetical protein LKI80_04020 [Sporolactobacillus sp.]|jgi:hypothetical protein|nr:hypothetical protein [Sporolactobacillus sp.]